MSVLAAILLSATPAAAPAAVPAANADEIVVIGERLKTWRGTWKAHKGVATCTTRKSTGDAAIDAIGCEALTGCITPVIPQMEAIFALKLPKAERERRVAVISQPVGACMVERRDAGVAALAERRAGA